MTIFDGKDLITRDEILQRITELEEIRDTEMLFTIERDGTYESLKDGNGEVLRFATEADAEEYLEREDYVRDRFSISEEDSGFNQYELEELQRADREGMSDVDGWEDGVTLRRKNSIDESYAREYASDRGYREGDSSMDSYIDWDSYIDNEMLSGAEYIRLDGENYYLP